MNQHAKAIGAVIVGNTIFGFSFIFSKMALQITLPSVLIAVRFVMAFITLNLIVIFGRMIRVPNGQGGKRPLVEFSLRGKPLRNIILLALFQPILYFLCESYGIVYTSAAFAGTIIAVIPVAGIVFDVLIMHSKVRLRQVICAVLSAVGVAITTIGAEGMKSSVLGLLILLGAVAAGALFYVFSKKSGDDYNPLEQTYVMFALGSLVYTVFALVQCRGQYSELIFSALTQPQFIISRTDFLSPHAAAVRHLRPVPLRRFFCHSVYLSELRDRSRDRFRGVHLRESDDGHFHHRRRRLPA